MDLIEEVHSYTLHGVTLQSGDVVCTTDGVVTDGGNTNMLGQLWRALGHLVPGEIDHCAMYVGPGARFVEAGALGVITFEMPGGVWDAVKLNTTRWLLDTIVGVAYPAADRGLAPEQERAVRLGAANYVLQQATEAKPYNVNFFDPGNEAAFYCSQLIYKAYLAHGIDLDGNTGHPIIEQLVTIVFPAEIWKSSHHVRLEPPFQKPDDDVSV